MTPQDLSTQAKVRITNNLTTPWSWGERVILAKFIPGNFELFQEILTKSNYRNSELADLFDWFASEKGRLRPSPHQSRHFQGRI